MAKRQIATILNLKDNMSPKIVKVSANLRKMSSEAKANAAKFKGMQTEEAKIARQVSAHWDNQVKQATKAADKINKSVSGMVKKCTAVVKIGIGAIASAGAFAIKTGLTEAFDLETYRSQLETATKDTEKAGKVMASAINLANRTPFEAGELVAAAASLETYGLSSERWLSVYGDTAAALNKDIGDVQRGITKALSTGSFATIDDATGINRKAFEEYSKQNFGKSFLSKSGQVTDVELMQDAIEGLLKERYGGSMEKLSQTFKGSLSTITGAAKNAAAQMVGITNTGEIAAGSFVDYIRTKAKELADTISEWEASGKLDEIREKFSSVAKMIVNVIETAYRFRHVILIVLGIITVIGTLNMVVGAVKKTVDNVKTAWDFFNGAVEFVKSGVIKQTAAFIAQKAVMLGSAIATKAAAVAQWLFNTSLLGCPIVWIIVGVAALVAGIILLVKNWDKVVGVIKKFGDFCKKIFKAYFDWWKKWILDPILNFFGKIFEFWEKVKGWFGKIFGKKTEFEYSENHTVETDNSDDTNSDPSHKNPENKYDIDENATGTNYFKGGRTKINERGPELVTLPSGSQVMTADRTRGLFDKKDSSNAGMLRSLVSGFADIVGAFKNTINTFSHNTGRNIISPATTDHTRGLFNKKNQNVSGIQALVAGFASSVAVFREAVDTFSNVRTTPAVMPAVSGHAEPVYMQSAPIRRYNITNQFYINGVDKDSEEVAEEIIKIIMEELDNT